MSKRREETAGQIADRILHTNERHLRMGMARELCQDDPELLEMVTRRLGSPEDDRDRGSERETGGERRHPNAADLAPGSRLGAYRVARLLGRGGMGRVYLATREDQPDWKVALKVVNCRDEEFARRLDKERRIMARLRHPNIAQVKDTGVTADGLPWLALEYVDGLPLDQWCNRRKLTVRQRVALLAKVCDVVSFAHRNLVIHRDLKPANILVDAHGEPKLLDFGIAALLNAETGTQQRARRGEGPSMTPSYASPEQIRGETLGAATDVYSLGVLLFELLRGFPPYRFNTHSPMDIYQAVLEQSPQTLSSFGGEGAGDGRGAGPTGHGDIAALARERGTSPSALKRTLKGDLEKIAARALAKDISQRYGSVEALGRDLRNYLTRLPVSARPRALPYRARLFVARNRPWVLAAAVFVVTLLSFATVMWRQAKLVEFERDAARRERNAAQRVTTFLEEMFEIPTPEADPETEMTVPQVLAMGRQKLKRELKDQPEIRGRLLHTLGRVYANQGLFEDSLPLLTEAQTTLRGLAQSEKLLAEALLDNAEILMDLSEMESAEARLDEVTVLSEELGDLEIKAEVWMAWGSFYRDKGQNETAKEFFESALALLRDHGQTGVKIEVAALNLLASINQEMGDYEEAVWQFREALAMHRELDEDQIDLATLLGNLGFIEGDRGEFEEAERLMCQSLEIYRDLLGEEHRHTARTINNLGWLMLRAHRLEESEAFFRQSLALHQKLLPENHQTLARSNNNLGVLLAEMGAYEESEAVLREALRITRLNLGSQHPSVVQLFNNLSDTVRRKGDFENAETLLQEGLALAGKLKGKTRPITANLLNNLAWLLNWRDLDKAIDIQREALDLTRSFHENTHPKIARYQNNLSVYLRRNGAYEEAERHALEAIDAAREVFGDKHRTYALYLTSLAFLHIDTKRFDEAEKLLDEADPIIKNADQSQCLGFAIQARGLLLMETGATERAAQKLAESLNWLSRFYPERHPIISRAKGHLGKCLALTGQTAEARLLLEDSYWNLIETLGVDNRHVKDAWRALESLYEKLDVSESMGTYPLLVKH